MERGREGGAYEYGQGELAEIGGVRERPEDDGVSDPWAADEVETAETR